MNIPVKLVPIMTRSSEASGLVLAVMVGLAIYLANKRKASMEKAKQ